MRRWQMQEAKNKLSEVVRLAAEDGPQYITVNGREAAVVMSPREYEALIGPRRTLLDVLRSCPVGDEGLIIEEREVESAPVLEL